MDLGSILRKMRIEAGLSQEAIAPMMHMSRSTISKVENNLMDLKSRDFLKWCEVTRNQEVLIALVYGADSLTVIQTVIDAMATVPISTIIGGMMQWISIF